nr:MAG: hypothetical protein [Chemarfal virus 96]
MFSYIYPMPIRLNRRKGLRRRRRTQWYNKKYSTAQIARAAWKATKYIRGLVNSEMYHKDAQYTLGNSQSTIWHLTTLAQGDGPSNRTGNSILLKRFTANGYMYVNPSATTNTRVMLALIQDKQQVEDAYPSLSNIFASSVTPNTLLNSSNLGRFSILWRKQYTLGGNATGGANAKQIKIYKRFQTHVRYNGTAETDIHKNGLYLVMITSEPTNFPTINFETRLSYHDN